MDAKLLDSIDMYSDKSPFFVNAIMIRVSEVFTSKNGKTYQTIGIQDNSCDRSVTVKVWGDIAGNNCFQVGNIMGFPSKINVYNSVQSLNLNVMPVEITDNEILNALQTHWQTTLKPIYGVFCSTLEQVIDENTKSKTVVKDLYAVVKDCHDPNITKSGKPMRKVQLEDNTTTKFVYATIFGDGANTAINIGNILYISNASVNVYNDTQSLNINCVPVVVEKGYSSEFAQWYTSNFDKYSPTEYPISVLQALEYDLSNNHPEVIMDKVVVTECEESKAIDHSNRWKRSLSVMDPSVTESRLDVQLVGDIADTSYTPGDVLDLKRVKLFHSNGTNCAKVVDAEPEVVTDFELSNWWDVMKEKQSSKSVSTFGLLVKIDKLSFLSNGCRVHLKDVNVKCVDGNYYILTDTGKITVKVPNDMKLPSDFNAEIRSALVTTENTITVNESTNIILK